MMFVFGTALWFVLLQGKNLEAVKLSIPSSVEANSPLTHPSGLFTNLQENCHHPLAILIIQLFCIMITARTFGYLMTKIGQPSVVGEIIAGIALGPSLLGLFFPGFSQFLFPDESLKRLQVLSQIGLVLFMFIIGMELNVGVLKKKAKAAVIISHASIIFPYFLGVLLAYFLYPLYAPASVSFSAFALFIGIAMSITAFPVLARIIQERNLTHTTIGTIIITCAAADDITAWCLLALVVAIASAGGMISALSSIMMTLIYVLLMWFVMRPLLHRLASKYDTPESVNKTVVASIFGLLLLSSYLTEIIGIHALFGAFLAGVIMPPQKEFKRALTEKIEDVSLVLLLPLFFVFTGLRTQIGLLNHVGLWGSCFLIIDVAVLGKFVGSTVAARFVGQSWKDSLLIGVLMNTRGLMELVVLNIGYDVGILSAEIFTMMVLMALVTTFMAGPLINVIESSFASRKKKKMKKAKEGFHILLSFGSPQSGSRLLELMHCLSFLQNKESSLTVVHFSPSADISILEAEQHEQEAFEPINHMAERLDVVFNKIFKVTDQVEKEMIKMVDEETYDVVLVGGSRELFSEDRTAGKVKALIQHTDSAVGVFIDRGFRRINRAVMIVKNNTDSFLLKYIKNFLSCDEKNSLIILDEDGALASSVNTAKWVAESGLKGNFTLTGRLEAAEKEFYKKFDIAITSLSLWDQLSDKQNVWLNQMPSVLILSK